MLYSVVALALFVALVNGQATQPKALAGDLLTKHNALVQETKSQGASIKALFVGDSITEGWKWGNWGKEIWDKSYGPRGAHNYGIAGDTTSGILWRIQQSEFDGLSPHVVVLMIGTNNIAAQQTAADIAAGVKAVQQGLAGKMASAKFIVMAVLPRNSATEDQKVKDINSQISSLPNFTDMGARFRAGTGLNASLYQDDKLHINAAGYQIWHDTIESKFASLLGS